MIANYHSHTYRCNHAEGTEEGYVLSAIQRGLQILGFSDHTPHFYPEGHSSKIRMKSDELAGYVETLRQLRHTYGHQIDIRFGLEAEYYPDLFPTLLPFLRDAGIEYLILGQHWINNEIGENYNGRPTNDVFMLERYCDQVIEAMDTGVFTYFAHPDLLNFTGDPQVYRTHMQRLCQAAAEHNLPLEINLLGLNSNRHYPNPLFWQIAAEVGCSAILGGDIHDPAHFALTEPESQARAMAAELGLTILDTIELRPL